MRGLTIIILAGMFGSACAEKNQDISFLQVIVDSMFAPPQEEVARQPMKIIGAGLGRTSTLSLYTALNSIGYKTHHMKEVIQNGQSMYGDAFSGKISRSELMDKMEMQGYNATTDFPGCLFYKDYLERNPTSKVILSVRDSPEKWAKSVKATIGSPTGPGVLLSKRPFSWVMSWAKPLMFNLWSDLGGVKILMDSKGEMDTDLLVAGYKAWIEDVKASVPPEQLLVHKAKEGWTPICEFLDLKGNNCPSNRGESYPRVNDKESMQRSMAVIRLITTYFDFAMGIFVGMLLCTTMGCLFCRGPGRTQQKAKTS